MRHKYFLTHSVALCAGFVLAYVLFQFNNCSPDQVSDVNSQESVRMRELLNIPSQIDGMVAELITTIESDSTSISKKRELIIALGKTRHPHAARYLVLNIGMRCAVDDERVATPLDADRSFPCVAALAEIGPVAASDLVEKYLLSGDNIYLRALSGRYELSRAAYFYAQGLLFGLSEHPTRRERVWNLLQALSPDVRGKAMFDEPIPFPPPWTQ